jgi:hypothetical protein
MDTAEPFPITVLTVRRDGSNREFHGYAVDLPGNWCFTVDGLVLVRLVTPW